MTDDKVFVDRADLVLAITRNLGGAKVEQAQKDARARLLADLRRQASARGINQPE